MQGGGMQLIEKILKKINITCAIIAEILVILIVLLVVAEIIGRFIFGHPIPGQVEIATLSLVVIVYLGVAYTQMLDGHIRVDVLISRVKGAKREFLEAFVLVIGLFSTLMMVWATGKRAIESTMTHEFVTGVVNFPIWPGRCSVTFGFILLSLTLIIQIIRRLLNGFDLINQGENN